VKRFTDYKVFAVVLVLSVLNVWFGWLLENIWFVTGGLIGLCYVLARVIHQRREAQNSIPVAPSAAVTPRPVAAKPHREPVDPNDTKALVEQMMAQGRYALLLRPQIAANLTEAQFNQAAEALQEAMGLVPDGEVVLGQIDRALDDGKLEDEEITSAHGRTINVQRFFLDRYPVTNRQYYEFVASGGYEQMSLWRESIWPAVLDMVDRTGHPGPRYWQQGCYLSGEENHPVVGVSWYEADAYTRWVGKRLPSDAEWVKAGTWPVPLSATARIQRKYPWGDDMDRARANLWGSGPEGICDVNQFAEGVSVGGVYQLIGNVWEWTSGSFRGVDHPSGDLTLPVPMKSIRGGAFDTYFDNQATCQFQSGENPLGRKHNIGFRCAVGVCDLVLTHPATAQKEPATEGRAAEEEAPVTEEVHV